MPLYSKKPKSNFICKAPFILMKKIFSNLKTKICKLCYLFCKQEINKQKKVQFMYFFFSWVHAFSILQNKSHFSRRADMCKVGGDIHLIWPPAAAWAWGHFWNPLQCSRSVSQLSLSGSCTKLWRSGGETRNKTEKKSLEAFWPHASSSSLPYGVQMRTHVHAWLDYSFLRSKLLSEGQISPLCNS